MTAVEPTLDLHDLRARARKIGERRAQARDEYQQHAIEEANHEHAYRKRLAASFALARTEGQSAAAAEIFAQGQAADARRDRDIAHVLARAALLRIEELERNAATLRQEAEMSKLIDRPGGEP